MADLVARAPPRSPAAAQRQDSGVSSGRSDIAGASESRWTPTGVEERLRKAAALQEALVSERLVTDIVAGREPKGIGIIGIIGGIGGIGGIGSALPADGDDSLIADAAEALSWVRWLEPDDAALVLARLDGAPWKSICWRFGISRPTADRRYRYGLGIIAWRLAGHRERRVPSLRSMMKLNTESPRYGRE